MNRYDRPHHRLLHLVRPLPRTPTAVSEAPALNQMHVGTALVTEAGVATGTGHRSPATARRATDVVHVNLVRATTSDDARHAHVKRFPVTESFKTKCLTPTRKSEDNVTREALEARTVPRGARDERSSAAITSTRRTESRLGRNGAAEDGDKADKVNVIEQICSKAGKLQKMSQEQRSTDSSSLDHVRALSMERILSLVTAIMMLVMLAVHCAWVTSQACRSSGIALVRGGERCRVSEARQGTAAYWGATAGPQLATGAQEAGDFGGGTRARPTITDEPGDPPYGSSRI